MLVTFFLPCCERVLQVLSTNLMLLNSEVFIWSPTCRVSGNDLNRSTLFYLSAASLLVVQAFLKCWPWGWENARAGHGVLGVCVCVHFSLFNPKPNIVDFWNHCPRLFSPSVHIIESWRFCFLFFVFVFWFSRSFILCVLQVKNSRPQGRNRLSLS